MRQVDQVLDDEDLVEIVYEALVRRHPKSRTRGRLGTPAEVVLRMLVLKHLRNWSFQLLEQEVRPVDSPDDAVKGRDIVVTITTSRDPVLRGEWLRPGALVCAVGANNGSSRELDNVVLSRASFVCCDLLEQARIESADLIEPVEQGVLDWLEVHELHEVVSGELPGRQDPDDIVVFKSNGIAAWDVAIAVAAVERARERKVGKELSD